MDKENIKVDINKENQLVISAEKKTEVEEKQHRYLRKEFAYSQFVKTLTLPDDVDKETISASYDNGILIVEVPRKPKQSKNLHWMECIQECVTVKTGEKKENRFVFLTNCEANRENIASLITAGRGRWFIEDHFNTQKNRGGRLHHKFNRNNFAAIKNWHHIRELTCVIDELVKHTAQVVQLKKENQKLSWKELYKSLNAYLTMLSIEEDLFEFDLWCKYDRQVRLE